MDTYFFNLALEGASKLCAAARHVCLGAWPLGGGMGVLPDRQVIDTVHAALDCGITFIDTAEGYQTSESVLGKALADKRDKVILATKLSGDHSLEHMNRAIENSLRALKTDYIDLYQLHGPKPEYPIEQTMGGLLRLKEQGKIRYIGVSNFSAEQHAEALQYGHVDSSQPMCSMLVRTAGMERVFGLTTSIELYQRRPAQNFSDAVIFDGMRQSSLVGNASTPP